MNPTEQACEQEFTFKSVQIFKKEVLGKGHKGPHGTVYKAKCDELICAAKVFELKVESKDASDQFESKYHFLKCINHPNIVPFLKIHHDPETHAPVLFMELMDKSLTQFLETSLEDVPYHIQVNLSYDIAQALAFLHANGITHRNLSSNNVLLIAGSRAKVTDFGMEMYTDVTNEVSAYMPPEAFNKPSEYTEKLDIFSFGVLLVQILTRQIPQPTDCIKRGLFGKSQSLVPEVQRRKAHISNIEKAHPLQPIILKCLKDNPADRDSSQQLCQTTYSLKQSIASSQHSRGDLDQASEAKAEGKKKAEKNGKQKKSLLIGLVRGKSKSSQLEEMTPEERQNQSVITTDGQSQPFLNWEDTPTPCSFQAGSVAVLNGKMYLRSNGSEEIHIFDPMNKCWDKIPSPPSKRFTLVAVDGKITSVGGSEHQLYCWNNDNWTECFIPMPTERKTPAAVYSDEFKYLVVAGGCLEPRCPTQEVDILNVSTSTQEWLQVCSLPFPTNQSSMVICNGRIYITAGNMGSEDPKTTVNFKSVFFCFLKTLMGSTRDEDPSLVWVSITAAPVCNFSLVAVNNSLFAVGGKKANSPVKDVYQYNSNTCFWDKISQMCAARSECLPAILPDNKLVIVGGCGLGLNTEMCTMQM